MIKMDSNKVEISIEDPDTGRRYGLKVSRGTANQLRIGKSKIFYYVYFSDL